MRRNRERSERERRLYPGGPLTGVDGEIGMFDTMGISEIRMIHEKQPDCHS